MSDIRMSPFNPQLTSGSADATPDRTPSEAVIDAVATASETDAIELADEFGPLYDAIDPSALDALFDREDAIGTVRFRYAGYQIVVDHDGRIELADAAPDA
ncbi:HalOD1 output domain-containing protein [Halosolutus amylolyticus]|uniref:HalOD1 output domain-containing protein n=1 Tax=Halosolutus amylolyticus TaxID=2932267 RepID=A0ABD5PU28_9EURY|nr:HalOD1 output domain-containing protein [Halosolutus amylolyticus]